MRPATSSTFTHGGLATLGAETIGPTPSQPKHQRCRFVQVWCCPPRFALHFETKHTNTLQPHEEFASPLRSPSQTQTLFNRTRSLLHLANLCPSSNRTGICFIFENVRPTHKLCSTASGICFTFRTSVSPTNSAQPAPRICFTFRTSVPPTNSIQPHQEFASFSVTPQPQEFASPFGRPSPTTSLRDLWTLLLATTDFRHDPLWPTSFATLATAHCGQTDIGHMLHFRSFFPSKSLLVELWPRVAAMDHPNCAFGLLWVSFCVSPSGPQAARVSQNDQRQPKQLTDECQVQNLPVPVPCCLDQSRSVIRSTTTVPNFQSIFCICFGHRLC